MSQRDMPKPGEFYRNLKNEYCQIIVTAKYTESDEIFVIGQKLYGDFSVFAAPLSKFLEAVDKEKYPDSIQQFCYEQVEHPFSMDKSGITKGNVSDITSQSLEKENVIIAHETPAYEKSIQQEEEQWIDQDVESFLDASSYKKKQDILMSIRNRVTKKQLHDMAAAIDVIVNEGTEEEMYFSLLSCLKTKARFEIKR